MLQANRKMPSATTMVQKRGLTLGFRRSPGRQVHQAINMIGIDSFTARVERRGHGFRPGVADRPDRELSAVIEDRDSAEDLVPEVGIEPTRGVNPTGF